MSDTNWFAAGGILLAGIVIGVVFVYVFARRGRAVVRENLELRDLEAKRDALVEQLREMDDEMGEERARLEREAAEVLRQIDSFGGAPEDSVERRRPRRRPFDQQQDGRRLDGDGFADEDVGVPRAAGVPPKNPALAGFAWGAGSMAVLALLAWFVMSSATPREQQQQPEQQTTTDLAQLEASVRNRPNDVELRMQLIREYLNRENLMGVYEQTQKILEVSPNEPRALTYNAIVLMSMGRGEDARAMLERATAADATLIDAWVALAWVHTRAGRTNEAEAAIGEAVKRHPEEKEGLMQVLAHMRGEAPAPAPAAPAPAAGPKVAVTLQLENGIPTPPANAVIFVTARAAGQMSGPPVAVKRLSASLPVTFDLTSSDSMMGQPLPAQMRIDARVDLDGSATSREEGAPSASRDGVVAGSSVVLRLGAAKP